jgi:hypothetical protein
MIHGSGFSGWDIVDYFQVEVLAKKWGAERELFFHNLSFRVVGGSGMIYLYRLMDADGVPPANDETAGGLLQWVRTIFYDVLKGVR